MSLSGPLKHSTDRLAVFTPVTEEALTAWLRHRPVGTLRTLTPIAAGIENTNYFVTTTTGQYVLTLFEKLTDAELPFYLGLMSHLAAHGVPAPAPMPADDGALFHRLNDKPAALVSRLPGHSVMQPDPSACAQLGTVLARMHLAGQSFDGTLDNPRGPRWWHETAPQVMPFLDATAQTVLQDELRFQAQSRHTDLPRGPVHGDLFRDNVLFDAGHLTGVIDFYFAGLDALLFDVAVCANDWCLIDHQHDRRLSAQHCDAFLRAYAAQRPFVDSERIAWPVMLRAAALRFWLSRLFDFYLPRAGQLVHAHDPNHFYDVLQLRTHPAAAPVLP